jgi:transposase
MANMALGQISGKDRRALNGLLASSPDGQVLRRAIALKQWDEGVAITRIAAMLQVSRRSIHNWLARLSGDKNVPLTQRLSDGPRSGRPSHLKGVIDPLIDCVIDASPLTYGYQAAAWTAPLLRTYLADQHEIQASLQSVRLAVRRVRVKWKRPRYTLSLRPKTRRQAKGGSNVGFSNASGRSS